MIHKLNPDTILQDWEVLKVGLAQAIPLTDKPVDSYLNDLLLSIVDGRVEGWVIYDRVEEVNKIYGVFCTTVTTDIVTREPSLLIYALYTTTFTPQKVWDSAIESLVKVARERGIPTITAFTRVPRVVEIAAKLGGDVGATFITWRLK